MSKFLLHYDLGYLPTTEQNDWRRIRAHYEQLSEFERDCIIGLKEGGWANRRIAPHMGRIDAAIIRCFRNPLVVIRVTLTAHRYIDGILRTVLLPFHLQYPGLIFQQDNAKPHTTRVAMNFLTAYQTLPWPSRSPIEHFWDMMGSSSEYGICDGGGKHNRSWCFKRTALPSVLGYGRTATAGSDVVQSGRPIFDDFFQHLWPYIGNNTANVVFQRVKRL
ncbi:transposable element Tc1 transposase [Trichonephila clavipes]|nr:transposable element Tc1 transposase [Trichonephila clavipes]